MKHGLVTLVCLLTLVLAAAALAKDPAVESGWASAPILIDGKDQEWSQDALTMDIGSNAEFAIKNDAQNLYMYFLFKSPRSSTTIDFTGMRVFFDAAGKKDRDLGVRFFKKDVKAEEFIAALEKNGETVTEEQKAEIIKRKTVTLFECEVINKKNVPAPSDPAVQNQAPSFRSANKGRVTVYEFRIPLSRINQPGGLGAEPGQSLKLGFEWGGMTREAMQYMNASRAEASTRAVATENSTETMLRGGNEMGEFGGGGMDMRRDPRFKRHSFWVDVKLAAQK